MAKDFRQRWLRCGSAKTMEIFDTGSVKLMNTETLTAEDLSFLARPLYGFFSAAAGAVPPQPRPVWF